LTPLPPDVSDVEGVGSGVADGLPEVGAVVLCALFDGEAEAPPVGALLPQLAAGVGVGVWVAARRDVLALVLADAFAEALSLALALPVALALALPVALPFGLAPGLTVSLGLAAPLL
jgi:hypothetical protein